MVPSLPSPEAGSRTDHQQSRQGHTHRRRLRDGVNGYRLHVDIVQKENRGILPAQKLQAGRSAGRGQVRDHGVLVVVIRIDIYEIGDLLRSPQNLQFAAFSREKPRIEPERKIVDAARDRRQVLKKKGRVGRSWVGARRSCAEVQRCREP